MLCMKRARRKKTPRMTGEVYEIQNESVETASERITAVCGTAKACTVLSVHFSVNCVFAINGDMEEISRCLPVRLTYAIPLQYPRSFPSSFSIRYWLGVMPVSRLKNEER